MAEPEQAASDDGQQAEGAAGTKAAAAPRWAEVQEQLARMFKLAKRTDDMVALVWQVPAAQGSVLQWVRVSPVRVRDQVWLAVLADICPEAAMSPASALAYLNQLALGGILLWRGAYLLRQMVPLDPFDLRGLESLIRSVAHEALRLRLGLSSGAATLDPQLSQMFEE
jgi:hypothetical protein